MLLPAPVGFRLEHYSGIVHRLRQPPPFLVAQSRNLLFVITVLLRRLGDAPVVECGAARILGRIFSDHHRLAGNGQKRSEGVVDERILGIAVEESIIDLDNVAFLRQQFLLQEGGQIHLADEAYSLGILLVS